MIAPHLNSRVLLVIFWACALCMPSATGLLAADPVKDQILLNDALLRKRQAEDAVRRRPNASALGALAREYSAAMGLQNTGTIPRSPEDELVFSKLESQRSHVEFTEIPLRDALSFVARQYKVAILLDEQALKNSGIDLKNPLSVNVQAIKLSGALKLIIPPEAGFTVRNGAIIIGPKNATDVEADNPFARQYADALQEAGVEATVESLDAFLRLHQAVAERQEQDRELIAQLGDDDFFKREEAMLELMKRPVQSSAALEAAVRGDDPEVRWRAQVVLQETNKPRSELLYAVFVVIQHGEFPGLADSLLKTMPACHSDYLRVALVRALEATVTADDDELLRGYLRQEDVHVRIAAMTALERVLGPLAVDDLKPILRDPNDAVRMAAAERLIRHSPDAVYETLGQLLDSDDVAVRNRSIQLLRANLSLTLPYSAYAGPELRLPQAEAWRKAIAAWQQERPAAGP